MVYCGKPSKGCGECRARKTRCDQAKPECGRCRRANRPCPGYRDQLSLLFRDESQSVAQRAKAAKNALTSKKERASLAAGNLDSNTTTEDTEDLEISGDKRGPRGEYYFLLPNPSMVDTKDQASCFFFQTYAWVGASSFVQSNFHHHPGAPLGDKALLAGIASVGQATLANIQGSDSLRLSASREYGAALKLLNAALRDAVQVRKDTTLNAILLLSLYEIVTAKTPKSVNAWTNHVNGAMALLEMRKMEELQSPRPLMAFHGIINQIILGCVHRRTCFPPRLIELSGHVAATHCSPVTTCSHQLTIIVAKLAKLRADIDGQRFDNTVILSRALSLDSEMSAWVNGLSPSCLFDVHINHGPFPVNQHHKLFPYKGLSYVYASPWLSNVWNNYRFSRILLNEIILTRLRSLATDAVTGSQFNREIEVQCRDIQDRMRQLAADICHSVPYRMGIMDQEKEKKQGPIVKSSAGGFGLLYPLSIAAAFDGCPYTLRSWVLHCFHIIAHTMGINQAVALGTLLQARMSRSVT